LIGESVVVRDFHQSSSSSVDHQDFAAIIHGLLRRPLMYLHADQIRELQIKEKHGGLTEVDKIYISDIWNKFRSLPTAWTQESQSEGPAGDVAEHSVELATELKRLNVTVEKLRAALRQVAEHRDNLKDELEKLTKIVASPNKMKQTVDSRKQKSPLPNSTIQTP
jgi:hypothetical protein